MLRDIIQGAVEFVLIGATMVMIFGICVVVLA